MGGAVSAGMDNDELVDNLKSADFIRTPHIERVFRAVDRGDYFLAESREQAYRDSAWREGHLHLSAPCIYAKVMEGLELSHGLSFLNLGSGTGYLSTMVGLALGPYGLNHGIELYPDVIAYAMERLEEFKSRSAAIDAFKFCEPQFVHGNCLCLPPEVRLYDRVYCGASCPESHENYIKTLIKEGGILVMPLNDKLVKMTRTGQSTWESVSLLDVSFSSLAMPDPSHPPASVVVPSLMPPDLQGICREQVRTILRDSIDQEHPNLVTAGNHPVKPSQRSQERNIRRIIVPYVPVPFYPSDEDQGMMSDDADERDSIFDAQRQTANRISAVFELARSLAGQSRHETRREGRGARARRNLSRRRGDTVAQPDEHDDDDEEEEEKEEDKEEDKEEEEDDKDKDKDEDKDKDKAKDKDKENGEKEKVEHKKTKKKSNGSLNTEDDINNHEREEEVKDKDKYEDENEGDVEEDEKYCKEFFLKKKKKICQGPRNELKGDTLNHVNDNPAGKLESSTSLQNPVINEELSLSDDSKDESKIELNEESKPSSSDNSKDQLSTSVPALPVKSNKKREKFDSGVGDEIENSKDSDSDNVLDIEEEDNSMDIDSDSDYSEHHAPHRRKVTRLFDPYDPDCPCGGDCRDDGEEDCTSKKKTTDKKSDSSGDTEASERSKGPSIESYSIYMREKIKLLPVPLALKMYLNYNREL